MKQFIQDCIKTAVDLTVIICEYFIERKNQIPLTDSQKTQIEEESLELEKMVGDSLNLNTFWAWSQMYSQQDLEEHGKSFDPIVYYWRTLKLLYEIKQVEIEYDAKEKN